MAEKAKEVIRWMQTLPEDATVYIDGCGIALREYGSCAYLEVGGSPEVGAEEDEDEER